MTSDDPGAQGPAIGGKAAARLRSDLIGWMTTVAPGERPQPSPVWFLWEGGDILVYSLAHTARVRNVEANPKVSLNLDGDGIGGEVVIVEGEAHFDPDAPSAAENLAYVDKYRERFEAYDWSPEWFATRYPVAIRIRPERVRAW